MEAVQLLDVSDRTIQRDWSSVKEWLAKDLIQINSVPQMFLCGYKLIFFNDNAFIN